jgi:AraC-like DNA-binding protein
MVAGASTLRFSSADVPERERACVLREAFGRGICNMDIAPLTEAPYVDMELRTLPDLNIMWGHNSPHRMTVNHAPNHSGDMLIMSIFASPLWVEHPKTEFSLNPGAAVIVSTDQAVTAESPEGCRHVTLGMPIRAFRRVVCNPENISIRSIAANGEALRLLDGYLQVLQNRQPSWTSVFERTVVRQIYDLVGLAVEAIQEIDDGGRSSSLGAARLAVIKELVRENIRQRDLTISQIAVVQNITPRYIQMLFENEGTTFSAFVLRERLALAYRLLREASLKDRSISDIAFEAGFGDISYFNRAFRRTYGEPPSHVRRGEKS